MNTLRFCNISTQVTDHLRAELLQGRWKGVLPGRDKLCKDLGVSPKTIRRALEQMEREGILIPGGKGCRRRIATAGRHTATTLRLSILHYDPIDHRCRNLLQLKQQLSELGHEVEFSEQSLTELKMQVGKIADLIAKTSADAWIVVGGSREVLHWFSQQPFPAFAMMGCMRNIPIAAAKPNKILAQRAALIHLHHLGHRRIVQLCRFERTKPRVGTLEQAFLDDLQSLGIPAGAYHLPTWDGTRENLHEQLDQLFRVTPPTALFIPEPQEFIAVQQYLARRGLYAPDMISLICNDPDPAFNLCKPDVTHIFWDFEPIARRLVDWVHNICNGKTDIRQSLTKANFVRGGTIGKAVTK